MNLAATAVKLTQEQNQYGQDGGYQKYRRNIAKVFIGSVFLKTVLTGDRSTSIFKSSHC